jgi:hypothetical protein
VGSYFFSPFFGFSGSLITAEEPAQMSPLITVALIVPVQKTNTDEDFKLALMFDSLVYQSN